MSKQLFINLLDADLNLAATIPEKIEGLTWGPDLADGRHVLYVISDNDLNPALATQIYAFAIDPSLLDFQQQFLPGPLFPPGQVISVHPRRSAAKNSVEFIPNTNPAHR